MCHVSEQRERYRERYLIGRSQELAPPSAEVSRGATPVKERRPVNADKAPCKRMQHMRVLCMDVHIQDVVWHMSSSMDICVTCSVWPGMDLFSDGSQSVTASSTDITSQSAAEIAAAAAAAAEASSSAETVTTTADSTFDIPAHLTSSLTDTPAQASSSHHRRSRHTRYPLLDGIIPHAHRPRRRRDTTGIAAAERRLVRVRESELRRHRLTGERVGEPIVVAGLMDASHTYQHTGARMSGALEMHVARRTGASQAQARQGQLIRPQHDLRTHAAVTASFGLQIRSLQESGDVAVMPRSRERTPMVMHDQPESIRVTRTPMRSIGGSRPRSQHHTQHEHDSSSSSDSDTSFDSDLEEWEALYHRRHAQDEHTHTGMYNSTMLHVYVNNSMSACHCATCLCHDANTRVSCLMCTERAVSPWPLVIAPVRVRAPPHGEWWRHAQQHGDAELALIRTHGKAALPAVMGMSVKREEKTHGESKDMGIVVHVTMRESKEQPATEPETHPIIHDTPMLQQESESDSDDDTLALAYALARQHLEQQPTRTMSRGTHGTQSMPLLATRVMTPATNTASLVSTLIPTAAPLAVSPGMTLRTLLQVSRIASAAQQAHASSPSKSRTSSLIVTKPTLSSSASAGTLAPVTGVARTLSPAPSFSPARSSHATRMKRHATLQPLVAPTTRASTPLSAQLERFVPASIAHPSQQLMRKLQSY